MRKTGPRKIRGSFISPVSPFFLGLYEACRGILRASVRCWPPAFALFQRCIRSLGPWDRNRAIPTAYDIVPQADPRLLERSAVPASGCEFLQGYPTGLPARHIRPRCSFHAALEPSHEYTVVSWL